MGSRAWDPRAPGLPGVQVRWALEWVFGIRVGEGLRAPEPFLPTSPLVECASVGLSHPGGSGFTSDLHKLLEKYDDQWGQRGKSSVFPFVQHLLPLGHCGVTEICMAGPCSPGIYVLAGQGWQETSHEGAKNPEEEGSWGCGQGEPYRGRVTAPGIEDLAAFEDVRVGGEMFKVERKHQKKHGVRKRQGVVTSSE